MRCSGHFPCESSHTKEIPSPDLLAWRCLSETVTDDVVLYGFVFSFVTWHSYWLLCLLGLALDKLVKCIHHHYKIRTTAVRRHLTCWEVSSPEGAHGIFLFGIKAMWMFRVAHSYCVLGWFSVDLWMHSLTHPSFAKQIYDFLNSFQ